MINNPPQGHNQQFYVSRHFWLSVQVHSYQVSGKTSGSSDFIQPRYCVTIFSDLKFSLLCYSYQRAVKTSSSDVLPGASRFIKSGTVNYNTDRKRCKKKFQIILKRPLVKARNISLELHLFVSSVILCQSNLIGYAFLIKYR